MKVIVETPLSQAIKNGDVNLVNSLLEKGGSISDYCNGGYRPIHWAAWHNRTVIVDLLLKRGVPIDQVIDQDGDGDARTAFSVAAFQGADDVVKFLASRGANVDAQDDDGDTALHHAVFGGHDLDSAKNTVRLLLELGADPTIKNHRGLTPAQEILDPEPGTIYKPREWVLAMATLLQPVEQDFLKRQNKHVTKVTPM